MSPIFIDKVVHTVPEFSGIRPTPTPTLLPSRPLFVAAEDLLSSSSFILFLRPSVILFAFRCAAAE